jgi:hypothetical protein
VAKKQLLEQVDEQLLEDAGLVGNVAQMKGRGVRANTRMNYMQNKWAPACACLQWPLWQAQGRAAGRAAAGCLPAVAPA